MNRALLIVFLLVTSFVAASINTIGAEEGKTIGYENGQPIEGKIDHKKLSAGFRAASTLCFGCHSPDARTENPVAPTMASVKQHYVTEATSLEVFRGMLTAFVKDPSRENVLMPDAVESYGFMPVLGLNRDTVDAIAYYVFHTALGDITWYEANYASEQQKHASVEAREPRTEADYLKLGQGIALQTKAKLGSNLKRALQAGGTQHAIQFCNEQAVQITSSTVSELGARVQRVSDRPRNPENRAQRQELAYISSAHAQLSEGSMPAPAVQELGGRMVAYYPIVTSSVCLQCHGSPGQDISEETLRALNASYPDDGATGYAAKQLRGIWVVEMKKLISSPDNEG